MSTPDALGRDRTSSIFWLVGNEHTFLPSWCVCSIGTPPSSGRCTATGGFAARVLPTSVLIQNASYLLYKSCPLFVDFYMLRVIMKHPIYTYGFNYVSILRSSSCIRCFDPCFWHIFPRYFDPTSTVTFMHWSDWTGDRPRGAPQSCRFLTEPSVLPIVLVFLWPFTYSRRSPPRSLIMISSSLSKKPKSKIALLTFMIDPAGSARARGLAGVDDRWSHRLRTRRVWSEAYCWLWQVISRHYWYYFDIYIRRKFGCGPVSSMSTDDKHVTPDIQEINSPSP